MDAKRQVGAYLAVCERSLYEVIAVSDDGNVIATNCLTGYTMALTDDTIASSRLISPLFPAIIADLEAALAADNPSLAL